MKIHNRELTYKAKQLRANMTKEERHLWFDFLKNYPVKVQAQKVIGDCIVDFFCLKARLAIEIDGNHHYTWQKNYDESRTAHIKEFGIDVVRFDNVEVMKSFESVCEEIDREIQLRLNPR